MNSKRLHSARKADEGRPKGVNLFLFCLSIAIAAGCGAFYYSEYVTGFSFLYLSAPIASLYLSQIYLRESSHRICHLWRCSKRGAVLTTTRTLANWELGTLLLVSLSCPLGIVAWVLRQRGEWIGPTALLAIGSIGIRYLTPIIRARGLTRQKEPSRAPVPHRLPTPEHAPARTPPEHLLHRRPAARQALRTRGPQHRPRHPGIHRGRADRRLLDLEPSVSVKQVRSHSGQESLRSARVTSMSCFLESRMTVSLTLSLAEYWRT